MNLPRLFLILLSGTLYFSSCKKPKVEQEGPRPYILNLPSGWPKPNIPIDNQLTVEGVELGRYLFYDEQLSLNGQQSCGDCHHQSHGFTDLGKRYSDGSEGITGNRNSMPLFNLNWSSGYFWNGRQTTLESLIQEPMEAHHEMNLGIDSAVSRLKANPDYIFLFEKAFPGKGVTSITLRYAIAQFLRSIVSGGNTKWDEYFMKNPRYPDSLMTEQEKRGYIAFISEYQGDCQHCHTPLSPFFIEMYSTQFANNALDADPDTGYYIATGNSNDWGKFKTPSLRNLAFTAPYMHDGRFATLMEVIDHYETGIKYSPTVHPMLIKHMNTDSNFVPKPRNLTQQDKEDIIAFLMLLTDSNLVTNPAWSKPTK